MAKVARFDGIALREHLMTLIEGAGTDPSAEHLWLHYSRLADESGDGLEHQDGADRTQNFRVSVKGNVHSGEDGAGQGPGEPARQDAAALLRGARVDARGRTDRGDAGAPGLVGSAHPV